MKLLKLLMFSSAFILSAASVSRAVENTEIKMKSISFDPKRVEIVQGQSVIWKNVSYTDHSATSEAAPPSFDTGMIAPGKGSKPIRFDVPGEFTYHCQVHGKTMSGVVSVKAARK